MTLYLYDNGRVELVGSLGCQILIGLVACLLIVSQSDLSQFMITE